MKDVVPPRASGHWHWLAALPPLLAALGSRPVLYGAAAFTLLGIPLLDLALGSRPTASMRPVAASLLVPITAAAHILSVLVVVQRASTSSAPALLLVDGCALGVISALGMSVTHTACHARSRFERALGYTFAALVAHMQVPVEHPRHHALYASASDPGSAARGESFYSFFARFYKGGFDYLALLDARQRQRRGTRGLRFPAAVALPFLVAAATWAAFGAGAAFTLVAQALVATAIFFAGAYVGHYGLKRQQRRTGKLEAGGPEHCWNDSHVAGKFFLLSAGEHSFHHVKPTGLPWQSYVKGNWPTLPLPYSVMVLLAFFPPVFHQTMNARLSASAPVKRLVPHREQA